MILHEFQGSGRLGNWKVLMILHQLEGPGEIFCLEEEAGVCEEPVQRVKESCCWKRLVKKERRRGCS